LELAKWNQSPANPHLALIVLTMAGMAFLARRVTAETLRNRLLFDERLLHQPAVQNGAP
jgi:hypothetical protein